MKILTKLQEEFLTIFFKSILGRDFFLTGGTALSAFYLQHRLSQDIDLFTINQNVEFNTVSAEVLKIISSFSGKISNQVNTPAFQQFIFKTKNDELKIDFVKDTPVHFGKIKKVSNFQIDSLENIAVGKLLALFGRADAKDFIDMYFILESEKKITFNKLFNLAKKKDAGLSEFYLAGMMEKVVEIEYFPKTIKPLNEKNLKNYFMIFSDKLFKKIKP